jgi:hypothetical protein
MNHVHMLRPVRRDAQKESEDREMSHVRMHLLKFEERMRVTDG